MLVVGDSCSGNGSSSSNSSTYITTYPKWLHVTAGSRICDLIILSQMQCPVMWPSHA